MTAKRDLKKRARERAARTGESYTTARRQVLEARPPEPPPDEAIEVVDLIDLGAEAKAAGLKVRTALFPQLAGRVDPARALARLREVLDATTEDPAFATFRAVCLRGEERTVEVSPGAIEGMRRFIARAQAGVGGLGGDGTRLAME